jgi:hypothetical protein
VAPGYPLQVRAPHIPTLGGLSTTPMFVFESFNRITIDLMKVKKDGSGSAAKQLSKHVRG